jgi:TolB-like protein
MPSIGHTLKAAAICLAALGGPRLDAQAELRIAIVEPACTKQTRAQASLVRNAFLQAAAEAKVFQVFDRARTDQILAEHGFQNNGLVAPGEAREMGRMLGADLICTSEVQRLDDGYEVSAQLIDIVTGEILGTKSDMVESESSKDLREAAHELMAGILKLARSKADFSRSGSSGSGGAGSSGAGSSSQMTADLDSDIARSIKNFKSNAKWNSIKATCDIEVDLSGLDIRMVRQYGEPYYVANGAISIAVTDVANSNEASVEIKIRQVTDMSKDGMKRKIKEQIHVSNIIKELLAEME